MSSERASISIEYCVVIGIFVAIFLAAAIHLKSAGLSRSDRSMSTAATSLPCGAGLSTEQCR